MAIQPPVTGSFARTASLNINQKTPEDFRKDIEKNDINSVRIFINSEEFDKLDTISLKSAVYIALQKGFIDIADEIVQTRKFKELDVESLGDILNMAVIQKSSRIVGAIINSEEFNHLNVKGCNSIGSAFNIAAKNGDLSIVSAFIQSRRFNELNNLKDSFHLGTAMNAAKECNHQPIVEELKNYPTCLELSKKDAELKGREHLKLGAYEEFQKDKLKARAASSSPLNSNSFTLEPRQRAYINYLFLEQLYANPTSETVSP